MNAAQRLVRVTRECMMKGIEAVKPGRPISDIGRAIETHADAHGYSVVRSYCGHGIGEVFHNDLQIPHYFDPKAAREAPRWFNVEVTLVRKTRLLSLQELRSHKALAAMALLKRGNRLSITPVTEGEWRYIEKLL